MTVQIQIRKPSNKLSVQLANFADGMYSLGEQWDEIKLQGQQEGFTEEELRIELKEFVKAKLPDLTPKQIKNKLYYLTHTEEQIARVTENKQKSKTKDDNKTPTVIDITPTNPLDVVGGNGEPSSIREWDEKRFGSDPLEAATALQKLVNSFEKHGDFMQPEDGKRIYKYSNKTLGEVLQHMKVFGPTTTRLNTVYVEVA
jgi:hypothetical protein